MPKEYLYHVDEDDNVIEKVLRSEARKKNLFHRSTSIIVFNSKGDILVHKRTLTKDIYPGYYDLAVGGGLSYGESYLEGAKREVEEEIGVKDAELTFLFKFRYEKDEENNRIKTFTNIYKLIFDGQIRFQEEEVESGKFISLEKLKEMMKLEKFCPDNLAMFEKYLAKYHET
ncbi:MAG: NUDIX domain-containing protein [Candidatus Woesearchaeota archaeon]